MERYLDTLYLYRGDPVYTSPEAIDKMVVVLRGQGFHPVVIVDCAQRVPPPPQLASLGWEQHIDYVIRSLKALALPRGVAVGAVDEQAIRRQAAVHLAGCGKTLNLVRKNRIPGPGSGVVVSKR